MITTTLHNYDYHYLLFLKYDLDNRLRATYLQKAIISNDINSSTYYRLLTYPLCNIRGKN